ncbi:MAG TPA: D-alanyl-D-alanine carboxypeptidase, partial [Gaiellales bacterium]|nr:D-alanyl-D-alanine carboxypeptidase [Gaiellales bacterium]
MQRIFTLLAAVAGLLVAAAPAGASTLGSRVSAIVQHSGYAGSGTSISIWDDTSRRWVYLHNGRVELKPASNMKLTTAVTALGRIGTAAQLQTRVFVTGTRSGSRLDGNLFLVGGGDPSFSNSRYSARRFGGSSGSVRDL